MRRALAPSAPNSPNDLYLLNYSHHSNDGVYASSTFTGYKSLQLNLTAIRTSPCRPQAPRQAATLPQVNLPLRQRTTGSRKSRTGTQMSLKVRQNKPQLRTRTWSEPYLVS